MDHLLSLNSELTPATEHYILMMQCISDLDSCEYLDGEKISDL